MSKTNLKKLRELKKDVAQILHNEKKCKIKLLIAVEKKASILRRLVREEFLELKNSYKTSPTKKVKEELAALQVESSEIRDFHQNIK